MKPQPDGISGHCSFITPNTITVSRTIVHTDDHTIVASAANNPP